MKKLIMASVSALALAAAASTASVAAGPTQTTTQTGSGNTSLVTQIGANVVKANADVTQTGDNNTADIDQDQTVAGAAGAFVGLDAQVLQKGKFNKATVNQSTDTAPSLVLATDKNLVDIKQYSGATSTIGNEATAKQFGGINNKATITQGADTLIGRVQGNVATIEQTGLGSDNVSDINQQSSQASAKSTQSGTGNTSNIDQTDVLSTPNDDPFADVSQTGNGNQSTVAQLSGSTGSRLSANVTQIKDGNISGIAQTASGALSGRLDADVTQDGNTNTSEVNQWASGTSSGILNAVVNQTNDKNNSEINQNATALLSGNVTATVTQKADATSTVSQNANGLGSGLITADVTQTGKSTSDVTQTTAANLSAVLSATVDQDGADHSSSINQLASGAPSGVISAIVDQEGTANISGINQTASGQNSGILTADVTQSGTGISQLDQLASGRGSGDIEATIKQSGTGSDSIVLQQTLSRNSSVLRAEVTQADYATSEVDQRISASQGFTASSNGGDVMRATVKQSGATDVADKNISYVRQTMDLAVNVAPADSPRNFVALVEQVGLRNDASITQDDTGTGPDRNLRADIKQIGGDGNVGEIAQQDLDSSGSINQTGNGNQAIIHQNLDPDRESRNNSATIGQSGDSNFGKLVQEGNDGLITATQAGFSGEVRVNQVFGSDFATAKVNQIAGSVDGYVEITQSGDTDLVGRGLGRNTADVTQEGDTNSSISTQSGNDNRALVIQTGDNTTSTITQSGSAAGFGNLAEVTQILTGAVSTVTQVGSSNIVTVNQ